MKYMYLILIIWILLSACAPLHSGTVPTVSSASGIRLYLAPLPQEAHRLTLVLSRIVARRSDGTDVPVLTTPLDLESEELIGAQKKLLSAALPPGEYLGLEVTVGEATLLVEEGKTDLMVPERPIFVAEEFIIDPRGRLALILALSPDRLIHAGYRLTPRFSLYRPPPPLPRFKGFASESGTGAVSVFEKNVPQAVSLVAPGAPDDLPRDLVLDSDRLRLYVALEGKDAIAVVDVVTETVQGWISLRPGDRPGEMALSSDGEALVSVNAGSHTVSIVDALSLYEREHVQLSSEPFSALFGPRGDRVYVLHPTSSSLSLVDTANRREVVSVRLEDSPLRGALSPDGRFLYLLTQDSPDLLVLDATTLAVIDRKFLGYGALSLAVHPANGLLYIGMQSGEVFILDAGVGLPIDSFRIPGAVVDMAIDLEENALFTILPSLNRVEKFDLVSKKNLGGIDIGSGGYAIAVMGEE